MKEAQTFFLADLASFGHGPEPRGGLVRRPGILVLWGDGLRDPRRGLVGPAQGAWRWHLDALAAGFPLGMAVGRIGDLINGEHYGSPTSLPWGIRYENAGADVPTGAVAYHPGGLYEIVLALLILGAIWLLRRRLRAPGVLLWTVVGLYAGGRFIMFFYRVDSNDLALGLDASQWISLLLVGVAVVGLIRALRPHSGLRIPRLVSSLAILTLLLLGGGDHQLQ